MNNLFFKIFNVFIFLILFPVFFFNYGDSLLFFNLYRYIFLPFIFLLFAFYYLSLNFNYVYKIVNDNVNIIYFLFITSFLIVYISLKFLKLRSFNYPLFDSGIYLNHLYYIFNSTSVSEQFKLSLGLGHYQPIKFLLAYLFYFDYAPYILYALQSVLLFSSLIPLYKLLKFFKFPCHNRAFFILLFITSPILMFQDILGFHPDIFVTPLTLWAFYFIVILKPFLLFLILNLICICGEQWIPLCIGFSLYYFLFISKKDGIYFILYFIVYFIFCLFYILPFLNSENAHIFSGINQIDPFSLLFKEFPYEWIFSNRVLNFYEVIFTPRKILFFFFLLLPFAFIPFFSRVFLVIGGPDLMKILLSNEPLHYAIEGHYAVSLLPLCFISCIVFLNSSAIFSLYLRQNLPVFLLAITIGLGIGHSPAPYSYDFWLNTGSRDFKYSNYVFNDRSIAFETILKSNFVDQGSSLEITNHAFAYPISNINSQLKLFPSMYWRTSDVIIIDLSGSYSSGGILGDALYKKSFDDAYSSISSSHKICHQDSFFEVWCKK